MATLIKNVKLIKNSLKSDLVVSTEEVDAVGIRLFQRPEQENAFDAKVTTIHVVPHEQIFCLRLKNTKND